MNKQFFGTDGIRGAVGQYPVTADFMLKLGWSAGREVEFGGIVIRQSSKLRQRRSG